MAKAASKPTTKPKANSVNLLIEKHKAAARIYRNRDRDFNKLEATHPDLTILMKQRPATVEEGRERARRQRRSGILTAFKYRYLAFRAEKKTFEQFVKCVPRNAPEVQRYARYLMLVIRNRAGGNVNPSIRTSEIENLAGYEAYQQRCRFAFCDLYHAVQQLAK